MHDVYLPDIRVYIYDDDLLREKCLGLLPACTTVSYIFINDRYSLLPREERVKVRGHDENDYPFLIKASEDIRQDQRIQALFNLMNDLYSNDPNLIHMTTKTGIIEWLDNTKTLKDVLDSSYTDEEGQEMQTNITDPRAKYYEFFTKVWSKVPDKSSQSTASSVYGESYIHCKKEDIQENFRQIQKSQFIVSYAVLCTSQYILGIGDRHQSNFLIDTTSGQVIGIDFGSAFSASTISLPVPELIPIRLTRQLVNLMNPIGTCGLFRSTIIHTMNALRENSDLLLSTMDVFIKEPLMDWVDLAIKSSRQQVSDSDTATHAQETLYAKERINSARNKLNGINPATIT
ncbi:unnamed protein product, partial [Didymodactylos carnosus]